MTIQAKSFPIALSGSDFLAIAKQRSWKTATAERELGREYAAVQDKIKDVKTTLEEKIDDLRDMESTNQVLIAKERQSNDELQTAL